MEWLRGRRCGDSTSRRRAASVLPSAARSIFAPTTARHGPEWFASSRSSHRGHRMTEYAPALGLDASNPFQAFQNLMPYRVQDILLVSSLYDSFTLQEDGRLNELIVGEFLELSLHQSPGLTHVARASEALELARREPRFNLIITAPQPGDLDATRLAREVKRAGLDVPVVMLAFDNN